MSSWDLLEDRDELELHKTRLLNVEERPFKRITKRLGTISTIVGNAAQPPPSPNAGEQQSADTPNEQLRSDLTLDFAAFDSSIARLQFLLDANARERERYQADQERIVAECQGVRANNTQLREQLEAARATLAQRKKFDELADKITSNRLLRPREDQIANLAKLEEECKELERESETYSETWKERKDQFNRIMEEGMLLRRQIRDEKEEVDRREGMNEGDDEEGEVDRAGQTPRNEPSENATPRPDGDSQLKVDADTAARPPSASNGGRTPMGDTPASDSLRPVPEHLSAPSRSGSQAPSRGGSPMPAVDSKGGAGEDVEMGESGKDADEDRDSPGAAADAPDAEGSKMEVDE
ncbi:THO complex subunit mft1 [Paramyrothecium foliicola]|nr:THO complex subunit mft1 [Paramyrothecium foliicola]